MVRGRGYALEDPSRLGIVGMAPSGKRAQPALAGLRVEGPGTSGLNARVMAFGCRHGGHSSASTEEPGNESVDATGLASPPGRAEQYERVIPDNKVPGLNDAPRHTRVASRRTRLLPCTVLLVDDMHYVRDVLRIRLELEGFTVVGEAADGGRAVELARQLQPDVAVMDHQMPVLTGVEAVPRVKAASPGTHVIIFSSSTEVRARAMAAGADAFVAKSEPLESFVQEVAYGCAAA